MENKKTLAGYAKYMIDVLSDAVYIKSNSPCDFDVNREVLRALNNAVTGKPNYFWVAELPDELKAYSPFYGELLERVPFRYFDSVVGEESRVSDPDVYKARKSKLEPSWFANRFAEEFINQFGMDIKAVGTTDDEVYELQRAIRDGLEDLYQKVRLLTENRNIEPLMNQFYVGGRAIVKLASMEALPYVEWDHRLHMELTERVLGVLSISAMSYVLDQITPMIVDMNLEIASPIYVGDPALTSQQTLDEFVEFHHAVSESDAGAIAEAFSDAVVEELTHIRICRESAAESRRRGAINATNIQ